MTEDDLIRLPAKLRISHGCRTLPDTGKLAYLATKIAVIACPSCGKRHEHGWASGPRVAHCDGITLGKHYYIVCDDNAEPAP